MMEGTNSLHFKKQVLSLDPSTAANRVCLAKWILFIDRQSCEVTVITAGAAAGQITMEKLL